MLEPIVCSGSEYNNLSPIRLSDQNGKTVFISLQGRSLPSTHDSLPLVETGICNILVLKDENNPTFGGEIDVRDKSKPPEKAILPEIELSEGGDSKDIFAEAMADVKPLKKKPTVPRRNGIQKRTSNGNGSSGEKLLSDFIQGRGEFDWSFHPHYQEGGPQSDNRRLIRKLRRGDFSVQAELDLHGFSRVEALEELERFLYSSSRRNLRCVRVIHGKGKNSKNSEGVLRKSVPRWLSTRRFARLIVAFTSARPHDGGVGASYVLLRKKPQRRRQP